MEVTIQYTGQLADIAGAAEETVAVDEGARLETVLANLARKHGAEWSELVLDAGGTLRPSLLVIVDGEQVDDEVVFSLDAARTVMLMTPIAGG